MSPFYWYGNAIYIYNVISLLEKIVAISSVT